MNNFRLINPKFRTTLDRNIFLGDMTDKEVLRNKILNIKSKFTNGDESRRKEKYLN